MNEVSLPNDLINDAPKDILLYDYVTKKDSQKQFINLKMNTFSFLQEGKKEVFTNNNRIEIGNQSFLVMKSGHCLMTEETSSPDQKQYRSMLLFFSNQAVLDFLRRHPRPSQTAHEFAACSIAYDDFIQSFVSSLQQISRLPSQQQYPLLKSKFDEIMLYLINVRQVDFLPSLLASSNQEQSFLSVVEVNKFNRLTLSELAFLCNMSVSSFKRNFTKHYSESPSKWFQSQRLQYAAHLLQKEKKRPSELSMSIAPGSGT
ncbi:MAG: AraC family transcriptional regulator, partial [Bacteroidota bacterium]